MDAADLMLFALGASQPFGQRIAHALGGALSPHEEREFEDGEHKARPLASVRGRDVYVVHALYGEPGQSANDKLCRLLFFIGAVKDAGAARVTVVAPYLAYSRKDRRTQAHDPVITRYVAALFEAVGTDVMLTIDVHNPAAYQNAFRCRTELLEAGPLFAPHLLPQLRGGELVVVSPDAGGMKRAERLRQRLSRILGAPVEGALAEKHRSDGVVTGHLLAGDVRDKTAVIIDDLISSGGTLARTARACREHGARAVIAVATHGLFAAGAETELAEPALERIVVTDTVPPFRIAASAIMPKVTVLPCAPFFAEAIRRLHADESIEELISF